MKKIIFVFLLFISCIAHSTAQSEQHIMISGNPFFSKSFHNLRSKPQEKKDSISYESKIGFTIKAEYQFYLFERGQLSIGISYSNWRAKRKNNYQWGNQHDGMGGFAPVPSPDFFIDSYTELGLPIALRLYTEGQRLKYFVKAGITPTIGQVKTDDIFSHEEMLVTNVKWDFAVGIEYQLSDRTTGYLAPNIHSYLLTDKNWAFRNAFMRAGIGLEVGMRIRLFEN